MDDEGLELLLFPAPDWTYVEKELRRRSVTRVLLWEEYRAANPDGFGYTWFCTTFEAWKQRARPSMRQTHIGGEKVFVDFAGNPEVVSAVHHSLGDRLVHSAVVGSTHQAAGAVGPGRLPGPRPTFFFAPDRVRQRSKDWGNAAFNARIQTALEGFITANGWLQVTTHKGSDALGAVYQTVLSGQARPEEGHMVSA